MSNLPKQITTIDLSWHGVDDATSMEWISDDGQSSIPYGPLDQGASIESQAVSFAHELLRQGHDGSGRIHLI